MIASVGVLNGLGYVIPGIFLATTIYFTLHGITWLESLIETVQLFDSRFTEEIELAWRVVLAPGIAYMKFKYDKPATTQQREP